MLWTDDVLFLHTPRSAGRSVKKFLADHLRGPLNVVDNQPVGNPQRTRQRWGNPHLTLTQAAAQLATGGRGLDGFERIIAVLRDPYEIEISLYHHLQSADAWPHAPTHDLALAGDFEAYLAKAGLLSPGEPHLERFFEIDGVVPPNLTIVPIADLDNRLPELVEPFVRRPPRQPIPRINVGSHPTPAEAFDARTESMCAQRHRWYFDRGYGQRLPDRAAPVPTSSATTRQGSATVTQPSVPIRPFRLPANVRRQLTRGDEVPSGIAPHTYILTMLDRVNLADDRVLSIEAGVDLAEPVLDGRLEVGELVAIESSPDVTDAVKDYGVPDGMQFFTVDVEELLTSTSPLFRSLGPFDVIIVRRLMSRLDENQLRMALSLLREMTAAGGSLFFDCTLTERTLSGLGAADKLYEIRPDMIGDDDPAFTMIQFSEADRVAFYRGDHIVAITEEAGWQVRQLNPPRPQFQHQIVATPADTGD